MGLKKMITLFVLIFCITLTTSIAEIRNGYETEIKGMRASLKRLTELLHDSESGLTFFQRSVMKKNISKLEEYIAYFELTEKLIEQFRTIAPALYLEIDTLSDPTGQRVTVHIKFVPEKEMQLGADGTTNIDQCNEDKNVYKSEYGPHTVLIKIASVARSLSLLAHEFGHVKYQVANLAEYVEYYKLNYQNDSFNSTYVGHNSSDRSGLTAAEFENVFRRLYSVHKRTSDEEVGSPLVLLHRMRKNLQDNVSSVALHSRDKT
jgi:predicted DNA-binding protein YlxM (UPF0122 family)